MALWTGLGQAATVAQLVGADVGGLISMIMQATLTARQNRKECEQLARRVLMIAQLLPHVQEPEAAQQLAGLGNTLRDAHELVMSCQGRGVTYQLVMAGRQAESFREVQSRIDSYLIVFPVISHIGITRRLERIYNVLVQQDDSTRAEPSRSPQSWTQLQAVVPHGTQEFTFAEMMAATNNFSPDSKVGEGGFARVYRGRLQDGRYVAVKRMKNTPMRYEEELFRTELDILSRLRHKHIIRLLGSCVRTGNKDKRLQATTLKKKIGLLTRWSKEPEERESLIVYEYMENGSLFEQLQTEPGERESLSPLVASWKMRINVLLGVARALEHLHCHANQSIVHRDVNPANILLDANWVPCLSDFGLSVAWQMATETRLSGTIGYLAPECLLPCYVVNPSIDLYSLGMVMVNVLTGKTYWKTYSSLMADEVDIYTLLSMEGPVNLGELLDKRPVPEPTPGQLLALEQVAQTAARCTQMEAKDRPAISDIVSNLEMVLDLICRDEPGSR